MLIDVQGLRCPLPVLKTAKRMSGLPIGARVLVRSTDPLATIDVPHFCAENGHRLVAQRRDGDITEFEIEKGGPERGQA